MFTNYNVMGINARRISLVLFCVSMCVMAFPSYGKVRATPASECLYMTDQDGQTAMANKCDKTIEVRYCGVDIGGSVGECGRDFAGFTLEPSPDVHALIEGSKGDNMYYFFGCFKPLIPFNLHWNSDRDQIIGECIKR